MATTTAVEPDITPDGPTNQPHTAPRVELPNHTSPGAVQTVVGKVSPLDPRIEQFNGIPYGNVPGRWQHSTLRTSLPDDLFDASEHGPKCPQPDRSNNTSLYQHHLDFPAVGQSEFDCLNLFITRPSSEALAGIGKDSNRSGLPVYVYIHGGAFGFGAGSDPMWEPTRFVLRSLELRKPIIAVNINYRLNIFGFAASSYMLASQDESSRKGCNFSVSDQKIALQWVKRNISCFGGDADNVVLGGQSAGGCSVNVHLLDAKNSAAPALFKRAIIQSGALTSVGIAPIPMEACDGRWNTLCDEFDISSLPKQQQLEALRAVSTEELLQAVESLGWGVFPLACDRVSISVTSKDTWFVDLRSDLEEQIAEASNENEAIEVLIGNTESEGSCFVAGALRKLIDFETILALFEAAFENRSDALQVLATYGITAEASAPLLHQGIFDFVTHSAFAYSVRATYQDLKVSVGDMQPKTSGKPSRPTAAQLYCVKFGNPFPGPYHENPHHCVDLIYQFDGFHDALIDQDRKDAVAGYQGISNLALCKQMQDYWIFFIHGDKKSIDDQSVLVFEKNRQVKIESMQDSPYWVDVNRKLDLMGRFRLETALALQSLLRLAR